MKPLTLRASWITAALVAGAALGPHAIARAQECATDADCNDGYRCKTESYESCSGGGMCDPDGDCTETDVTCETVEYSYCTNALCTTDADCPTRMACQAQTQWICDGAGAGGASAVGSGGATAAGAGGSTGGAGSAGSGDCMGAPCEPPPPDAMEPPSCHEEPADSICVLRYNLPCAVDSDCGGGFDCVESYDYVCTGDGAAGSSGAGAGGIGGMAAAGSGAPAPMEPTEPVDGGVGMPGGDYECHQEPSGTSYCQLQDLPCSADVDCPDGLECHDQWVYGPCSGGSAGSGVGGGDPDPMTAADGGVYSCPEPELQQRCMPPEYGGMTPPPGTGGSSGGGAEDPGVPGGAGSGSAGSGTSAGAGGSSGAGGATGGDDDGSEEPGNGGHGHGRGHGKGHHFGWLLRGCSAGGPIGGDPVGWLALALVALVMRRRSRV